MNQKIIKLTMLFLTLLWFLLFFSLRGQVDYFPIRSVKGATRQIDILTTALESFGHDIGRYPTTQEGLNILVFKPKNLPQWKGPYLTQQDIDIYFDGYADIRDVWGTPYVYYSPAQHEKGMAYELYSCGQDRKDDLSQGDDIPDWKRANLSYYPDEETFVINSISEKIEVILIMLIPMIIVLLVWKNKVSS